MDGGLVFLDILPRFGKRRGTLLMTHVQKS